MPRATSTPRHPWPRARPWLPRTASRASSWCASTISYLGSPLTPRSQVAEGQVDIYRVAEGESILYTQESENFPLLSSIAFESSTQATSAATKVEGFLTFQGDEMMFGKNAGPWIRRYAVFDGHSLHYWQFPEHVGKREADVCPSSCETTSDYVGRVRFASRM